MAEIEIKPIRFSASQCTECETLRAENARLAALLDAHGIDWRVPEPASLVPVERKLSGLNTEEKIALFRRLFRGRTDVYPIRWTNKAGESGYAPACANEWRSGVCEKPRIKCSACCYPPASWSAKASTIHHWTLWYWQCRSRGKVRSSNM